MNEKRKKLVDDLDSRIRKRRGQYVPTIIVCGAGEKRGTDQVNKDTNDFDPFLVRRDLVDRLNEFGFFALMFEEDFDLKVPSLEELEVCRFPEVDKVVVFSHSPAAISEFSSFMEDPLIRTKLVVLVPEEYHPFSNPDPGYLDSVFWRILVEGGQVLPYDASQNRPVWESVGKYFEAYRVLVSLP